MIWFEKTFLKHRAIYNPHSAKELYCAFCKEATPNSKHRTPLLGNKIEAAVLAEKLASISINEDEEAYMCKKCKEMCETILSKVIEVF